MRIERYRPILLVALLLATGASAHDPPQSSTPGPALRIQYLGVSGFWITYDGLEVMTAPMYSNPGGLRLLTEPIPPDPSRVNRFHPPAAAPHVILVGHGHYDHLMDVPEVYRLAARRRPDRLPVIVGSSTVRRILAGYFSRPSTFAPTHPVIPEDQVVAIDDRVDTRRCATAAWINDPSQCGLLPGQAGRWYYVEPDRRIRVMPLCSAHPPQVLGAVHLWPGCLQTNRSAPPERAADYPEGPTFSYLIDLLDGRDIAFRLYFQDAPTNGSLGRVPESLLAQRRVDVALLAAGNWDVVSRPEAAVAEMTPPHVILGHWEDFFRSQDWPAANAPTQWFGEYESRIRRAVAAAGQSVDLHRPRPQEVFCFDRQLSRLPSRAGAC